MDASSAVYPVTGLAPDFYMQLTDETWPWLWELRALFAMLTYHKDNADRSRHAGAARLH